MKLKLIAKVLTAYRDGRQIVFKPGKGKFGDEEKFMGVRVRSMLNHVTNKITYYIDTFDKEVVDKFVDHLKKEFGKDSIEEVS